VALSNQDIKLLQSERMTDFEDGGGRLTTHEVVDGQLKNVFDPISDLDTVYGAISLRKIYAGVMTDNTDTFYGSNVIISSSPADPLVQVAMYSTGDYADGRGGMKDYFESYLIGGGRVPCVLMDGTVTNSQVLATYGSGPGLVAGRTYMLSYREGTSGAQFEYFSVTSEVSSLDSGNKNNLGLPIIVRTYALARPLTLTLPGLSLGANLQSPTENSNTPANLPTIIRETVIGSSKRYYGVKPLVSSLTVGDRVVHVGSPFVDLVPTSTSLVETTNVQAFTKDPAFVATGVERSISATLIPNAANQIFLNGAVVPASITTSGGITLTSTGDGFLMNGNVKVASIDYMTGTITPITGTFSYSAVTLKYTPAVVTSDFPFTFESIVTPANRAIALSKALPYHPAPGTLKVKFISDGHIYTMQDDLNGKIKASDDAIGSGTISYSTGLATLLLGNRPDVDSSVVWYVSAPTSTTSLGYSTGAMPRPYLEFDIPDEVIAELLPDRPISVSFGSGTVTAAKGYDVNWNTDQATSVPGSVNTTVIQHFTGDAKGVLDLTNKKLKLNIPSDKVITSDTVFTMAYGKLPLIEVTPAIPGTAYIPPIIAPAVPGVPAVTTEGRPAVPAVMGGGSPGIPAVSPTPTFIGHYNRDNCGTVNTSGSFSFYSGSNSLYTLGDWPVGKQVIAGTIKLYVGYSGYRASALELTDHLVSGENGTIVYRDVPTGVVTTVGTINYNTGIITLNCASVTKRLMICTNTGGIVWSDYKETDFPWNINSPNGSSTPIYAVAGFQGMSGSGYGLWPVPPVATLPVGITCDYLVSSSSAGSPAVPGTPNDVVISPGIPAVPPNVVAPAIPPIPESILVPAVPATPGTPAVYEPTAAGHNWNAPATVSMDLKADKNEKLVAGVRIIAGTNEIVDKVGRLILNPGITTGLGVDVGTIDLNNSRVTCPISTRSILAQTNAIYMATSSAHLPEKSAMFILDGAPFMIGAVSLMLTNVAGEQWSFDVGSSGTTTVDDYTATVNFTTGYCKVVCNTSNTDKLFSSALVRYSAISEVTTVLDANILGADTTRLPQNGKIPIFRNGSVIVVHNTQTIPAATYTNGQTVDMGRTRINAVTIRNSAGAVVPKAGRYSFVPLTGILTFINVDGLSQPLTIEHRIEDMLLATDVNLTGDIKTNMGVSHDFATSGSYVSSALLIGNMQGRVTQPFDQQTWTDVWSNAIIGSPTLSNYNHAAFPITTTNLGAQEERWLCLFTSSISYKVIGETMGQIAIGLTTEDCAPVNGATDSPYFVIDHRGWGGGWAVGNVLRFNTHAANYPIDLIRTVKQGTPSTVSDNFHLIVRGNAE